MPETSRPLVLPATSEGTLGEVPARRAAEHPDRVAFSVREEDGWRSVTSAGFAAEVDALAKGLLAAGVGTGDVVGIMSRTRYEWTLADFALWAVGAVPVPVYETSSPDQVEWILGDSGAVAVLVETETHLAAVEKVRGRLPALEHVWVLDHGDLETLARDGADVGDDELRARGEGLSRESLATVIYTSGTTGRPKGVELTHGNFLTLAENTAEEIAEVVKGEDSATLLFLPLAHVFARFIEVLAVAAGVRMGHSADLKTLMEDFASFRPTFILAVPRVFEKVYNSAEASAEADGKGRIFAAAASSAIAWSEALDAGTVPLGLRLRHAVFDRLVYARLRAAMGGRVQYAVSGGAPLGTRLGHFFRGIGVSILEGYGLTETTAPATVNRPATMRIGTVGPPLPGVGIRIADDGEVCIRGINVMRAYRGNPEASAQAVVDGWFHTGDLGELDEDGYLRITGRKKEILVTAGGKNVAPAVLEDRLRAHPLISQCIVVGDGKPFIAALVTLDEEMYPTWAANHGLEQVPLSKAKEDPQVRQEVQRAVDDANTAVSKAESIRKFAILDTDFTEHSGHLTPSLKLKRTIVMREFADEVDALYGG
ncbi:long-chain fatty acid--CoA ligase [Phycicoccus endophyticus]|uniref:Acyl-CoA synthetase n=1 Tax=Phycicoccus endophyticus TaxID=1690220 RepID=A0A7G9R4Y5_9MICO|nr:AMP-dependent synthetase/ligase [Phycicoccus endophyticus]NHI18594.1 long-chain fatty acid--CoA ligase [Phycicoccus endophyticus]QNN50660.1 long-chain fatty acid--CoA ligase [Phycicoccus endophyticus]GGL22595.1 long-chain-fatty-acid--CoA ligase [Phycicoccus endophyticus]